MTETKKNRESYAFTPEDFVRAWATSESAQEVADKLTGQLGKVVPKDIVLSRATAYRKAGVNLKYMGKKARPKLDVNGLNNLNGCVTTNV